MHCSAIAADAASRPPKMCRQLLPADRQSLPSKANASNAASGQLGDALVNPVRFEICLGQHLCPMLKAAFR